MKDIREEVSCCTASRPKQEVNQEQTHNWNMKTDRKLVSNDKMVYIPGGTFLMGTNHKKGFPADGEGPIREVKVNPFYIDSQTVSNGEFQAFITDTGYKTEAEQYGWSFVFFQLVSSLTEKKVKQKVQNTPWWWVVKGATWSQPEGPDSTIENRMDHPDRKSVV